MPNTTPEKKGDNKALWTMLAIYPKNRTRYHVAGVSFVSFCGKVDLLVRDYCEWQDGALWRIGEGGGRIDSNPTVENHICKICLKKLKSLP